MNASAYLQRHGWRGEGHPLDSTNRGLAKPLLVSKKSNFLGIGTKKNDFGNSWWNKAFDKTLQSIGNKQSLDQTTPPVFPVRSTAVKQNALYSSFVKAETLSGTIEDRKEKDEESTKIGIKLNTVKDTDSEPAEIPSKSSVLDGAPGLHYIDSKIESSKRIKDKKRKREDESEVVSDLLRTKSRSREGRAHSEFPKVDDNEKPKTPKREKKRKRSRSEKTARTEDVEDKEKRERRERRKADKLRKKYYG